MNGNSQFEPLTNPPRQRIVRRSGLRQLARRPVRTGGPRSDRRAWLRRRHQSPLSGGLVARIRLLVIASCAAILFAGILVAIPDIEASHVGSTGAPTTPPAEICGNSGVLQGPSRPPANSVSVPAGNNSNLSLDRPNTTYWFDPGTHTLGSGKD